MQLQFTPETPEEALQVRAYEARCMELGTTSAEQTAPWLIDQASAAVNRAPLTEDSVQAAETRAQAAAEERARIEAEKLATTTTQE